MRGTQQVAKASNDLDAYRMNMIDLPLLFLNTVILRPYVFIFLIAFLITARWLIGWRRTSLFLLVSWITAFL
jgi:hypothetical protein